VPKSVIITCAATGGIHTPTMSPYLPITAAEITDAAVGAAEAASMGGNLRVGLEDSLYISKGELAKSNAEQVIRIRGIIEALGYRVATADEARQRLALKGSAKVNF
jgi:uncharacterized protein (DUF849 family)